MGISGAVKDGVYGSAGRMLRTVLSAPTLDRLSRRKSLFQILVYHRVLPKADPFAMSPVTSEAFDRQMALLRSRFRPASLDQLLLEMEQGDVKPGTVCVTFDDGYADNCEHAWPVLQKYGIPATIYLATGLIGTGKAAWYDQVLAIMRETKAPRLDWEPAGFNAVNLVHPTDRAAFSFRLLEWLKGFSPQERDAHMEVLAKKLGPANAGKAMLTWDQVKSMVGKGIVFGAHTENHPILSKVSPTEMATEIVTSKSAIENQLQIPVRHFAYPNGKSGDYNAHTMDILKQSDFFTAVTTEPGVNDKATDRFQWKRRQPWEADVNSLYLRMAGERITA
jgi:peptidoglycan/xylan/chitin deacetylase (PgdA/CDA1 family)